VRSTVPLGGGRSPLALDGFTKHKTTQTKQNPNMPLLKLLTNESDSPCSLILRDGLYEYLNITKSANFSADLRTYFQSDTFKQDLRNNKWGGSLNVIVDDIPLGLSANASDAEISNFRQKTSTATSIQIAQSSYDHIASKIPNVDLAREYTKCIIASTGYGFSVDNETITEALVVLKILYRKRISEDPMPKVIEAYVKGGRDVKGLPAVDSDIEDEFVISFLRIPTDDAVVIINTTREAFTYPIPKDFGAADAGVPVGTIIASNLTFDQFRIATKDDKIAGARWLSYKSKWSPCDGRQVPQAAYVRLALRDTVPDMRGVFLRGLNQFDPATMVPQKPNQLDPDARVTDSFQADQLKKHTHPYTVHQTGCWRDGHRDGAFEFSAGFETGENKDGGSETRPKNVAVFYYIRIN
jgi:hypothetical protein